MIKLLRLILLLLIAAAIGFGSYLLYSHLTSEEKPEIETQAAKIKDIRTMAQLCTVEIYSEIPVLDTINNKVIFAIQKLKGSISFDLDTLHIDTEADTIRVNLPKEIVTLYESTDPKSWEVIDTKNIGPITRFIPGTDKLTLEEENAVKAKIRRNTLRHLRKNGTITRARAEGAEHLASLLQQLYRRPVIVSD